MKRKSPIHHKVRAHTRQGRPVQHFHRGKGSRSNPLVKRKVVSSDKLKEFIPSIDTTRPPKRKPRDMGRRAYERLLKRWRPRYSEIPFKELNPYISKTILKEFGEEPEITIKSIDPESWELYWKKVKGSMMSPKGVAHPPWYILINPKYLGQLQTLDIKTADELGVPTLLVHEYLHTRSDVDAPERFREGFTEYLALRFVCKYFDVSKKVIDKVAENNLFISPYADKVRDAQSIALMANRGDKDKTLKWIRDIYFYKGDITDDIYRSLKKAGIEDEDARYLAKKDKLHGGKLWRIFEKYGYDSRPEFMGHKLGEII